MGIEELDEDKTATTNSNPNKFKNGKGNSPAVFV
jgi:hypothetical protein